VECRQERIEVGVSVIRARPSVLRPLAYGGLAVIRKVIAVMALTLALPAWAAEPVVAVLGDSLVAGYGLPPGDGLVDQTQAWLDAHGTEVTLMNAGVSGDTTAGGLARLDWTLTPEVTALVVALGGNDVLRGIDPATSRANLTAIIKAARARDLPVLLVASPAPGNYGADYKRDFEAIFPELAAEFDLALFKGFLPALVEGEIGEQALKDWFQADALHPNREGARLMAEAFAPVLAEFVGTLREERD
jgi:acyl-CoA thioesterase-1